MQNISPPPSTTGHFEDSEIQNNRLVKLKITLRTSNQQLKITRCSYVTHQMKSSLLHEMFLECKAPEDFWQ